MSLAVASIERENPELLIIYLSVPRVKSVTSLLQLIIGGTPTPKHKSTKKQTNKKAKQESHVIRNPSTNESARIYYNYVTSEISLVSSKINLLGQSVGSGCGSRNAPLNKHEFIISCSRILYETL